MIHTVLEMALTLLLGTLGATIGDRVMCAIKGYLSR